MKHFLWLLLIPTLVHALTEYTLDQDYRVRLSPSLHGEIVSNLGKTHVVVIGQKGDWREICLSGKGKDCAENRRVWVFKDGLSASNSTPTAQTSTEAFHCPDGRCAEKKKSQALTKIEKLPEHLDPYNPRGYKLPASYGPECSKFINPKGLGPYGLAMVNTAATQQPGCFYNSDLFDKVCRNYRALPVVKKNALIAMTFAAISETEAWSPSKGHGCHIEARAQGINDVADGLFQLEHSASQRRDAGRNREACATDHQVNTFSLKFQSECAVSTMADTQCKKFLGLFSWGSYWEKLRGNRVIVQRIKSTARQWRLCETTNDEED